MIGFVLLGATMGALIMLIACLAVGEHARRYAPRPVLNCVAESERRQSAALRDVIASVDRGEHPARIRAIASRALYPWAVEFDDVPSISEASHG